MRAALLALALLACATRAAAAPEQSRGEMLYENHCQGCHVSALHVRADHRAKSAADVDRWVRHWADYGKLGWSEEDLSEVSTFLVHRYYTFPLR